MKKDYKIAFLTLCMVLLMHKTQAIYYPKKIILVDKSIDTSNFPQSCSELNCEVCCGGIPPSCSDVELTCGIRENPDFRGLFVLLSFILFCIGGIHLIIIPVLNFIIMKRFVIKSINMDISIFECISYVICCPCWIIALSRGENKEQKQQIERMKSKNLKQIEVE